MRAWWLSVPEWAKPVLLATALAFLGWLASKAIPSIWSFCRQRNETKRKQHAEYCKTEVLRVLRLNMASVMKMLDTEIVKQSGLSKEEVETALHELGDSNQVHYWNGRWGLGPMPR